MSITVLIIDDEEHARLNISEYLTARGYEPLAVATLGEARQCLNRGAADIVLLDVTLENEHGLVLLEETARMINRPPIIIITAHGDIDMAVNAIKDGALDFIQKPIKFTQLEKSLAKAVEIVAMRRELEHLRSARQENTDFIVGGTPQMRAIMSLAQRAAQKGVNVLITGETGVGKDVLANAIHKMGPRAGKLFVAINTAAIQSTVIESEIFGYEAGAFTGAEKRKHGLMEIADGGVFFLDEISSMPLDMQAKLLRAIEERAFRRVGGTSLIKVDVQVIAASNRDLPTLIKQEKFREDLYYRLKVVELAIPPLRQRRQDIPELVGLMIRKQNQKKGMNISGVTPGAMQALTSHAWPGNIRELNNAIEHAMLFCDEPEIDLCHLPLEIGSQANPA